MSGTLQLVLITKRLIFEDKVFGSAWLATEKEKKRIGKGLYRQ